MSSPVAAYDALELTSAVAKTANGITEPEVHVLAYLGCLMAVYDGRPVGWWGYGFTATETGAPFGRDLAVALQDLQVAGWFTFDARVYRLSQQGEVELDFQRSLALNSRRVRYLDAATSAALSLPLPAVSDALAHEPGLRRALQYMRRKHLLDDASLDLVGQQFEALAKGLGERPAQQDDLMVPTVVWLTYLARTRGTAAA